MQFTPTSRRQCAVLGQSLSSTLIPLAIRSSSTLPIGDKLSRHRRAEPLVARAMLDRQSSIYEKVSVRLNRSCGGFITAQPERSSALGLLSSLLWLPPRLLASSLLVFRVLAPGLLVPWSSHGCCSPVLIAFILPGRL